MIIAVDFDGTLCESAYPSIGDVMPGAKKSLEELREKGHYIIIWTCRTGELLVNAINWLLEEGIPFDRVNDHDPENLAIYGMAAKRSMPMSTSTTRTSVASLAGTRRCAC